MNTDYSIRLPEVSELIEVFGDAAHALAKTGGDEVIACFLIANRDRIEQSADLVVNPDAMLTKPLRAAMNEARNDAAVAAWLEKRTIAAAMVAGRMGFPRAKQLIADRCA